MERLVELQNDSGLKAANRLSTRHVDFEEQKMKTRLCLQVFSNSAAIAIDVCRILEIKGFEGSVATVRFLQRLDK